MSTPAGAEAGMIEHAPSNGDDIKIAAKNAPTFCCKVTSLLRPKARPAKPGYKAGFFPISVSGF